MPDRAFTLVVAGDMLPTRPLFPGGKPARETFSDVLALIGQADVSFGNFEIPLSNRGHPREKLITFRASPDLADDVRRLGFTVLSLANNHILDYGYEALFDTIDLFTEREINVIGAGRNRGEAVAPVIVEANGRDVGFIAFTCLLPTGAAASDERPGLSPIHVHSAYEINSYWQMEEPGEPMMVTPRTWVDEADLAFTQGCIERLKERADFVCVSIHWGYGSGDHLADYQQPLGRALVDAGADLVLGNHPHSIHGIEWYDGKAIFYSPSTIIGQQVREDAPPIALEIWRQMSPDGYLTRIDVDSDGGYAATVVPISLDDDGLPVIAEGEIFARIADRLERFSAPLGTEIGAGDGGLSVRAAGAVVSAASAGDA